MLNKSGRSLGRSELLKLSPLIIAIFIIKFLQEHFYRMYANFNKIKDELIQTFPIDLDVLINVPISTTSVGILGISVNFKKEEMGVK